jgi:hypothetical protein
MNLAVPDQVEVLARIEELSLLDRGFPRLIAKVELKRQEWEGWKRK